MDTINDWTQSMLHETWVWFNRLTQPEWMVLLALVAGLGFLCMRGFKGRGSI